MLGPGEGGGVEREVVVRDMQALLFFQTSGVLPMNKVGGGGGGRHLVARLGQLAGQGCNARRKGGCGDWCGVQYGYAWS